MPLKSLHRDIQIPAHVTAWDWIFTPISPSPSQALPQEVKGFTNTDTNERLTQHQIKEYSIYLATALTKKFGLRENEVISICSPNSTWFPVTVFGVMRAGGIAALSSPAYGEDEMVHALKTANCKIIFASLSALDVVETAAERLGIGKNRVVLLDEESGGLDSVWRYLDRARQKLW